MKDYKKDSILSDLVESNNIIEGSVQQNLSIEDSFQQILEYKNLNKEESDLTTFKVIKENYNQDHLEDVYLIGCQHILDSTFLLMKNLIQRGLKRENISLIGKCYSTSREIYDEFIDYGIDVCESSNEFNKTESFDKFFRNNVARFVDSRIKDAFKSGAKTIVILDDGAEIIQYLNENYDIESKKDIKILAVEQTTAGTNKLKNIKLKFPVVNIARSKAKLVLESPIIAERILDILEERLKENKLFPKKALIIGMGAIGSALYRSLQEKYIVRGYDINSEKSDLSQGEIINIVKDYDLIIGCTGTELFDPLLLENLDKDFILVSTSSSDREFMSHKLKALQDKSDQDKGGHSSIVYRNITLLNSGYPINFDGKKKNIPVDKIQITLALLAAGVCQIGSELKQDLNRLPYDIEEQIIALFLEYSRENDPKHIAVNDNKRS